MLNCGLAIADCGLNNSPPPAVGGYQGVAPFRLAAAAQAPAYSRVMKLLRVLPIFLLAAAALAEPPSGCLPSHRRIWVEWWTGTHMP